MALLITPEELTERTQIDANVDYDKYKFFIEDVQVKYMGDYLGSTLTNKILKDFKADPNFITGHYRKVLDILKNIIIYETASQYVLFGQYQITSGGIYKYTSDDAETVSTEEVEALSKRFASKAQIYVLQLERYLCSQGDKIPEYNTQENNYDKRPQKGTNDMITWFLE